MKFEKLLFTTTLFVSLFSVTACNNQTSESAKATTPEDSSANQAVSSKDIKEERVSYNSNGTKLDGYVAYNDRQQGKRPGIVVIHEWWGLNDYTRNRAKQLAQLGYIAMAADMYGNGKTAATPDEAQQLATPFYKDPTLAKTRLDAAEEKLKQMPQTDTANIAAIGYCYGGYVVLNAAKLGSDLKGVVSFHGDLSGVAPDKKLMKAKVLVCHGADDKFVTQQAVDKFKHQMDSAGIDYTFKSYPNATHAFTNPAATETGKKFNMPITYNAEADKNSWNDMKDFLSKLFGK